MRQKMTDEMIDAEQNDNSDEPQEDSFPRAYVEELRSEAAENRKQAKAASEALEALKSEYYSVAVRVAVSDVLADPTDLPWSDDFLDENGLVNAEAVKTAAEELAAAKPHLARARGDAMQGYFGIPDSFDLATLMAQ